MGTRPAVTASALDSKSEWSYTVHLESGPVDAFQPAPVAELPNPDVFDLLRALEFDGEIPDSRNQSHWKYTPIEPWVRAHIYRCIRDDSINAFREFLDENPQTATQLGLCRDITETRPPLSTEDTAREPSYSQLYEMWHGTFTARTRGACQILAERLIQRARDQAIPAPETVFVPDEDVDAADIDDDDPTIRDLTVEKTADVWEHIRPMVLNHWSLKRHHNWQVPEATFFDAHASLATASDDVFPESGLGNMYAKSEHDRVHYPSTHRKQLKRFDVSEIRDLLKSVTRDLVREARREGELVGNLTVAIDQTKGHPWTGEIERDADGTNLEPWILGYRNDNDQRAQYYFQWATVQVVGLDIPLVLDAIPVRRGMTKGDIVDELLENATDLVDDIEFVMMDAGFDSEATKNSAEQYDVHFLNRKSKSATDKRRMWDMWENGEAVRIYEEEHRLGMPTRKTLYVPNIGFDEDDDDDEGEEADDVRQQLIRDFGAVDADDLPDESPFEQLLSDIHEEEEAAKEDINIGEVYVAFETNHPLADKRQKWERETIPDEEQRHAAARMIRRYGNRWGVENGYKKVGQFLPRSGSKDHALRYFGFAFACTLYNAWRLVDILVKLTVEDDPAYTPLVTASRFRAVAEGMFGLGSKPPPD